MNIYKFELKMYSRSIISWGSAIFVTSVMFMAFFPTFGADTELIELMLANYPEEILSAFGMNTGLSLSTIVGYQVFVFAFIQLFLAIQAANYGFSFLSVEERELTADFLMSKPISRQRILASKFLAAFTALTVINAITWVSTFVGIELFKGDKEYEATNIIIFLSTIILFQLFFMCFSMLISVSVKKVRSVLSFSMALAFGMYVLNSVRAIVDGNILGVFTPFYHFEPGYILEHGSYNIRFAMISIAIIIVSMVMSYFLYIRRDIHSL